MVLVLYTRITARLSEQNWDRYFLLMPGAVRDRIERYRRWEDRHAALFGKLLLMEGLRRYGYPAAHLENLSWDAYGRPFLSADMDFNISHSGEYVVCAFCRTGRTGIDIEKVRRMEITDFERYMTHRQFENIMASETPLEKFFNLWTRKEAVLKADGRGLMLPLDQVLLEDETAVLCDKVWRLKEISFSAGYSCHVATDTEAFDLRTERLLF